MTKRGKLRNLCLLTMTAFSITVVAGCSGQQTAPTTAAESAETTAASEAATTAADNTGETQESINMDDLPEIEDAFTESAYLSWTLTDEFEALTASAGSVLINWDEEAGTGTVLTSGDQINRADIKELIFYSAFGTYAIEEITSPEGVTTESYSGADQKLELPESTEEVTLTLSARYELTQEVEEITVTILP